jgi:hypothetical protein
MSSMYTETPSTQQSGFIKSKKPKAAHSLAVRYRHHVPLFSHLLLFFLWFKFCFIVLEVVKPIFPLVCLER